jgi:hypothetical protein
MAEVQDCVRMLGLISLVSHPLLLPLYNEHWEFPLMKLLKHEGHHLPLSNAGVMNLICMLTIYLTLQCDCLIFLLLPAA